MRKRERESERERERERERVENSGGDGLLDPSSSEFIKLCTRERKIEREWNKVEVMDCLLDICSSECKECV